MLNCLIITDNNWDNYPTAYKRLGSIDGEKIRINCFYSTYLEKITKICDKFNLNILRHSIIKNHELEKLKTTLKYMDFCIIFSDLIEYNTFSTVTIDICNKNYIPYFIFSNFTYKFLYNGEENSEKMKKIIKQIDEVEKPRNIITDTEYKIYNRRIFTRNYDLAVNSLRNNYSKINSFKKSREIKIIAP